MVEYKVEYEYNRSYGRYDLQLPYQLGDIKGLETVAHYERKDNIIFFIKTLTITDARRILHKAEEIKMLDIKKKEDPFGEEKHFEPDPDGVDK